MRKLPELDAIASGLRDTLAATTQPVGKPLPHESAAKHVSGRAQYVDDQLEPAGLLHAAAGQSTIACGRLKSMDLSAVRAHPGVVAVFTANDVPGKLDIGPVFAGDPLMVKDQIDFLGQPLFVVAATSQRAAREAARLAKVEYEVQTPILDVAEAVDRESFVRPPHSMTLGDADQALSNARHRLQGEVSIGGQEHLYLEGQVSMVVPSEDGGMVVYTSSQHPSEVQQLVAKVLGVPFNKIVVDMRRMGGGFGGKETQFAHWACMAALIAHHTGRPAKMRLPRADDMSMTGKRHPFLQRYDVGFNEQGVLEGIRFQLNGNCGYSPDLSDAVVDRAMFHCDNAYFLNNAHIVGNRAKTNTVSHTAFRGFGGPQGMVPIEAVMEAIARHIGEDPLTVRKRNLYGSEGRNMTPYGQIVEQNTLPRLIGQLEERAEYWQRREAIRAFNASSKIIKKGLALTPVKFGISFTIQHLNQAGALVHVYTDGSIQLNHGGAEMGQGLNTKVAQIVAEEFQVALDVVQVTAARTDKVPNTSPTAASSGTDLNGKAAQNAAQIIKQRLIDFAAAHFEVEPAEIVFREGRVIVGDKADMSFAGMAQLAYVNRISLSSTGYYRTPKIHYDREKAQGRPFFYYATGAAVSEVSVDTLTGEYKVNRVDILHDVGRSLNPAIDIGQIEGGFVQGMGWLTMEELVWNADGRLLTNSPATYKIPAISDTPEIFNVSLYDEANPEETVFNSKAVGEPPFMLAMSVWCALKDAIASLADYRRDPPLDPPATPEKVLAAVDALLSEEV